jgi:hypothetical protein
MHVAIILDEAATYRCKWSSQLYAQPTTSSKTGALLLSWRNQQRLILDSSQCSVLDQWRSRISRCHSIFQTPRSGLEATMADAFLFHVSSFGVAVIRLRPTHDNFFGPVIYTGYQWLFFIFCYQWYRDYKPFPSSDVGCWYVSNVSIIFMLHAYLFTICFVFCLHFVAFLCIFRN